MSEATMKETAQSVESQDNAELGLLDSVINVTKQTERSRAEELLKALTSEALHGTVTWSKNLSKTVNTAITAIDSIVSKQVSAVLHNADFQKLEGSWRGLHYLVKNSTLSSDLKIKVMNVSKKEIGRDLEKAIEFDQSEMFKKVYESEFGTPGGVPYSVLIGDYEFNNHPQDIELLKNMSGVAAASFAPFISAAGAGALGLESWHELSKPKDLEKVFESMEFARWRGLREEDDSSFVSLVMPRVLARSAYGKKTNVVEAFDFEEFDVNDKGVSGEVDHDKFCWMNAAYVMAARITASFADYGWCTSIRGAENGGKVQGLPTHNFVSDDGDMDYKCPTEVGITDRREAELSQLGFLPLCHYKNTDYAVFFGAQTLKKPQKFEDPAATENAAISSRLPYVMATSRFAHYLKVIARDKIGSFMEKEDVEVFLHNWITQYVCPVSSAGQSLKARLPLAEAKVEVKEVPGSPGSYRAVAYMRPWFQMEELTTSLRMVARIPEMG